VGVAVLDSVVVINEWHIFQSPPPETSCTTHTTHELGISLRSLILCVACEHALDGHTDTLHALDRRPPCAEQVETNYAVRIDVRVNGYRARGGR
jgi:hypothetical protein